MITLRKGGIRKRYGGIEQSLLVWDCNCSCRAAVLADKQEYTIHEGSRGRKIIYRKRLARDKNGASLRVDNLYRAATRAYLSRD